MYLAVRCNPIDAQKWNPSWFQGSDLENDKKELISYKAKQSLKLKMEHSAKFRQKYLKVMHLSGTSRKPL